MEYNKFDVIVSEFPFIDNSKVRKIRPSVIISSNEYNKQTGFIVIAMITSAKHSQMWNDIEVINPHLMELKESSIIRMKFANILIGDVLARIGRLDEGSQKALEGKLKKVF